MSCILVAHLPCQTYALDLMQKLMENSLTFMVSSKTDDITNFARSKLDDQQLMISETPSTSSPPVEADVSNDVVIQNLLETAANNRDPSVRSYSPVPWNESERKRRRSIENVMTPLSESPRKKCQALEPLLHTPFELRTVKQETEDVEEEEQQPSTSFDLGTFQEQPVENDASSTGRIFTRTRKRHSLLSIGLDELLLQCPSISGGCWFAKGVVKPFKTTDFSQLLMKCGDVVNNWPAIESKEVGSLFFFAMKKNARANESATSWNWHGQKKFKDDDTQMTIMRNYKRHQKLKLCRYMFYGNYNGEDTPALYQYVFQEPILKHQLKSANEIVADKVAELLKEKADDDAA